MKVLPTIGLLLLAGLSASAADAAFWSRKTEPPPEHVEKVSALALLITARHPQIADFACRNPRDADPLLDTNSGNILVYDGSADGPFKVVCSDWWPYPEDGAKTKNGLHVVLSRKDVAGDSQFSLIQHREGSSEKTLLVYNRLVPRDAENLEDLEKAGAIVSHEEIRLAVVEAKRRMDAAALERSLKKQDVEVRNLKKKLFPERRNRRPPYLGSASPFDGL